MSCCPPACVMACVMSPPSAGGPSGCTVVKRCRSRELRAGVLYVGCDCPKRNGIQDDCRRTECQGAPPCLVKPEPICCPSQYADARHYACKYRSRPRRPVCPVYTCMPCPPPAACCSPCCDPCCDPCCSPCPPFC